MSAQSTEQRETLRSEVLVTLKRLGSDRAHAALVMPDTITRGTHFGAACDWVALPVSAFCGRTLRGRGVVIPTENREEWKRQGKMCRECQLIAQIALERAVSQSHT
jgi:hypothetical protein